MVSGLATRHIYFKNMELTGNIVDVLNRKIFPGTVTIEDGKIKSVTLNEGKYENYILPGFIDSHVHVESSMLIPSEFASSTSKIGSGRKSEKRNCSTSPDGTT